MAMAAKAQAVDEERFVLRLYIAGQTPKCLRAFTNLKQICEEYLADRYRIEIIDLLQNPQLARGDQILAVPTLAPVAGAREEDHRRPLQHRARVGWPGCAPRMRQA